ncbi:O-antigen ligase family protein [Sphingomonas cavernae]|uniref:O-antigen ligase family protein n=1 Tax=Sphingomonas cavernae TaxID=2320861 RepID=A0A418WLG6_9SPHN|nr:O-antigen ligase family protein [Sphingomonas cavernae]RJF90857.1 O-antigen ligase family protein [Sphingomonas cavernae]
MRDNMWDAAGDGRGSENVAARDRSVFQLHWILIALLPVIMAAVTWGPEHYHYAIQVWLRFFSLPVLLVEAVVVGIALATGVRPLRVLRHLPVPAQAGLAMIVTIGLGTTLWVAGDPASAALRTNTTLIHICFGLSVAGLVGKTSPRFDREIWPLIVGGLLVYLLMLLSYVAMIEDPDVFDWGHLGLGVSNVRFVGFFAGIGAAASLALACLAQPRVYWRWVLAATLFMGLMFWSGSRNPVLAVSTACLIGAATMPAMRRMKTAIAWGSSVVGGALISLIHVPQHPAYGLYRMIFSVASGDANTISSGRLELWGGAIRAFAQKPIFGFGEGQFIHVVPEAMSVYHHPHNFGLQFLIQCGAVGGLCAVGLLIWAWCHIMKLTRCAEDQLLPAYLVLTALILAACLDGIFFFLYPAAMVALTIALTLGTALRNQPVQVAAKTASQEAVVAA